MPLSHSTVKWTIFNIISTVCNKTSMLLIWFFIKFLKAFIPSSSCEKQLHMNKGSFTVPKATASSDEWYWPERNDFYLTKGCELFSNIDQRGMTSTWAVAFLPNRNDFYRPKGWGLPRKKVECTAVQSEDDAHITSKKKGPNSLF
jgi:hypothetical protein